MQIKSALRLLVLTFLFSMLSCSSDDVNPEIKDDVKDQIDENIKDESEENIKSYFKARISNSNRENVLISYEGDAELEANNVQSTKEKIWNTWKEVNNEIEELPALSSETTVNTQLRSWDLIDEDPMPFYLFVKKGQTSPQRKPLLINLHGSGPKSSEFSTALSLSKVYADAPSVYFVPQIPNERRYRWWFQPVQNAWEKLFRLAMISDEIDPNKIYVLGISEGGYGSQRLGAYYADYLAGAGPMAGGEPLKNAPPLNYRNIAFSFHTGEYDTGFGRNKLTALASATFDSLATKYPGDFIHNIVLQKDRGHGIDYTLTTPWLVAHKRRVSPKHISWVYFPMHGRYRKGFYNVAIDKLPGMKEENEFNRIVFDIQYNKQDNTVVIDSLLMSDDMSRTKEMSEGQVSLFLDDSYIDYSKPVKVIYNGKVVHNEMLRLKEENLIESCALFGDPNRLYPAKLSIVL